MRRHASAALVLMGAAVLALPLSQPLRAQAGGGQQAAPGGRPQPPPLPTFDTTKPMKLDMASATARYRVKEQLVGIDFPNDAVGSTEAVTGTLVIMPDGSFGPQSKLSVDLKTIASDQELRDGYIRSRVLETDKFPTLDVVPKRTKGLPTPVPSPPTAQTIGFQMITDVTLKGVTKEVVWNIAGTLRGATVAGVARATITFADFNLPKPAVPLLLSADDNIGIEVEFRATRSVVQ